MRPSYLHPDVFNATLPALNAASRLVALPAYTNDYTVAQASRLYEWALDSSPMSVVTGVREAPAFTLGLVGAGQYVADGEATHLAMLDDLTSRLIYISDLVQPDLVVDEAQATPSMRYEFSGVDSAIYVSVQNAAITISAGELSTTPGIFLQSEIIPPETGDYSITAPIPGGAQDIQLTNNLTNSLVVVTLN